MTLIGICFLPRRRFNGAARVRENWFCILLIPMPPAGDEGIK